MCLEGMIDIDLERICVSLSLWERLVLTNQYNFSVTICSFSVLEVLGCFSA